MIAHRNPLCDLLRQEHRMIHLALMAMPFGPSASHADHADRTAVCAFIGEHVSFEDRYVVPVLRRWLPSGSPADRALDWGSWQLAHERGDRAAARRILAAMSRRLANEEAVLLPLIERRLSIAVQHELIDASIQQREHDQPPGPT